MSNDDLLQNFDDSDQFMKVNEYQFIQEKKEKDSEKRRTEGDAQRRTICD